METHLNDQVVDCEQAAGLILETPENVLAMVEQGTIPHSVLPTGKIVFLRNRLYDWLLSKDPTIEGDSLNLNDEEVIPSFAEQILQRFGYSYAPRLKYGYINLYRRPNKTFAQLHFPSVSGGIDLALWEGSSDENLPTCSVLKEIDQLSLLKGYKQGNNRRWLTGKALTKSPAAAYSIPSTLESDPNHPGWQELEELLSYTYSKR